MDPMIAILLLLVIVALKLGSSLILPIVVAGLLALLLAPAVRWLVKRKLPISLAAGLVMIGVTSTLVVSIALLANPAADWIDRAPKSLGQVERKIRRLSKPLQQLQQTAEKVQQVTQSGVGGGAPAGTQAVTVAPKGLMSKLSGTTISAAGALMTVIFLAYFLLAMGDRFRDKFAEMLPERHRREMADAIVLMQRQMSHYLLLSTLINTAVGSDVGGIAVARFSESRALGRGRGSAQLHSLCRSDRPVRFLVHRWPMLSAIRKLASTVMLHGTCWTPGRTRHGDVAQANRADQIELRICCSSYSHGDRFL